MPQQNPDLLGLLSDTHGQAEQCRAAVDLLISRGAAALVHSGDVGEEPVLDALAGQKVWFVWGNNDWDRGRLGRYAEDLGLTCLGDWGRFDFGGKRFVLTHGDDARRVRGLCDHAQRLSPDESTDYLLTGHTHAFHDRQVGSMRWINPGALYRARPRTIALLNVATGELEKIEVAPV